MFDLSRAELIWIIKVLKADIDSFHGWTDDSILSESEVEDLINKFKTALNTIARR